MIDDPTEALHEFFPRSVEQNPATGIKPPFVPTIETTEIKGSGFQAEESRKVSSPPPNPAFPPDPDIVSITPTSGPVAGGTNVAVSGNRFIAETIVKFGGVLETPGGTFTDEHNINSITPAHAAGAVDVLVENVPGLSDTLFGAYTFLDDPFISSVDEDWGDVAGGKLVTINGGNFVTGATVSFDGIAAGSVAFVNAGTITCITPANSFGLADVRVHNPSGQIALQTGGFRYQNAPGHCLWTSPPPNILHVNGYYFFTFNCPGDTGFRGRFTLVAFQAACTFFSIPVYPGPVIMRDGTATFQAGGFSPTAINPSIEFYLDSAEYDPAFNYVGPLLHYDLINP